MIGRLNNNRTHGSIETDIHIFAVDNLQRIQHVLGVEGNAELLAILLFGIQLLCYASKLC
ncbi:hypothetical protein D3C85_1446830 [compost metagenome]